jgi:hypothetical protein
MVLSGLLRSVGEALGDRVLWEKGRSGCVCRHDAQTVDVKERNVRKAVLEAMSEVMDAPMEDRACVGVLEGRGKLRSCDPWHCRRPMHKKMAMPPDVLAPTLPALTKKTPISWAALALKSHIEVSLCLLPEHETADRTHICRRRNTGERIRKSGSI